MQPEREPLILSVDTTTDVRSVAVVAGERVLAQTTGHLRGAQTANLLGEIHDALAEAGCELKDIDLYAVATGPGSFTGLRTGLATIKAFAATQRKPVVGVPTLHTIARAARPAMHVVAALPAGRGELFAQLLAFPLDAGIEELERPAHLTPAALIARALVWPTPLVWAGAGAHAQTDALREAAVRAGYEWQAESDKDGASGHHLNKAGERSWMLAKPVQAYALDVAALALNLYRAGRTTSAAELSALYVRLSDAELNERCRV